MTQVKYKVSAVFDDGLYILRKGGWKKIIHRQRKPQWEEDRESRLRPILRVISQ